MSVSRGELTKPRKMTLNEWLRFRKKGFVRCCVCGISLYPNQSNFSKEYTYDEKTKERGIKLYCKNCAKKKEEQE